MTPGPNGPVGPLAGAPGRIFSPDGARVVKVVSLVPSVTETLLAWGVRPVGVTRFCDAPGLPAMGGTKNPDIKAIIAAHPDVVVMDEEENRAEDAEALAAARLPVLATRVRSLEDVPDALAELASAVGRPAPARTTPSRRTPPAGTRLRAWIPIWRRPWMTVSGATYGSSILAAAGFDNIFAGHPDAYPTIEPGAVAGLSPEYVLAPSEPYVFGEKDRAAIEETAPGARLVFVDGRDLFWWGSRSEAALERLQKLAAELSSG